MAIGSLSGFSQAAVCEYNIANEWDTGFTANIIITNNTDAVINGWNLAWEYTGDNRYTSSWNAEVSGNNPYTATSLSWNANIQPGDNIEFGIQGTKGANAVAESPTITGDVCDSTPIETPIETSITYFDPDQLLADGLAEDVTIVDCTLSGGTETECYQVVISGAPADQEIGPFCPPTITSDASEGGIWFDGTGELYSIDGNFIMNLASIYEDDNWLLYDANGNVNITDTIESCSGAAQPNVEEEYQNHCVECEMSYVDGGISVTYLFPVTPVPLETDVYDNVGGDVGISLRGSTLAGAAPVADILANYTIAAFDNCAAHINLNQGYHMHGAVTECLAIDGNEEEHAALIGYAHDGYGIYAMTNSEDEEPNDLDECRGHEDEVRGYHYHVASTEENMFIGCFRGEQANFTEDAGGAPGGPPQE